MKNTFPRILAGSYGLLLLVAHVAHSAGLPANYQNLALYDLNSATNTAKLNPADKAQAFITWMGANDWHSLSLTDLYNLYGFINVDSVDRRHFSARWTGTITAAATGTYTLRQVQQYSGADTRLRVYVNQVLVLDSSGEQTNPARFNSQPVQITAGEPVPIEVQAIHDVPQIEVSAGAPMILLTWKLGQGPEVIIPSSAFTPSTGFADAGARGLKGEYFSDLVFTTVASTRLDPALDLIATWPPLAPIHQAESSAVFDACKAKLMDDAFLAQAASNGGPDIEFRRTLWRAAYRMRGIERQQLAQKLIAHPELMQGMTPGATARLMQAFFMLPGKEHLTLICAWALNRPEPRYQTLPPSALATSTYENTVYDDYWRLGHVLQGPNWNDVQTLWDRYLVRSNGECNLAIAYLTAYAAREESYRRDGQFVHVFTDRIQQALDDTTVTGDKRVSWLLARAFADEVLYSGGPQVSPRSQYLDEARLVAESSDYKFWTLQEIAARYASLGDVANVNNTIGDFTGATPDEQVALAAWRSQAADCAATNSKIQADDRTRSDKALADELQHRLAIAQQRGNQDQAARYQRLLQSTGASQKNQ